MNPRKFQRLARKGRTTKYLRRKIMRDLGAHDACMVSVLRGWTWDVGRKSRWPVPLDMYIAQRERQIHEGRMRRMRDHVEPLPARWVSVSRGTPFPKILPPRDMFEAEPEGIRWYTRL